MKKQTDKISIQRRNKEKDPLSTLSVGLISQLPIKPVGGHVGMCPEKHPGHHNRHSRAALRTSLFQGPVLLLVVLFELQVNPPGRNISPFSGEETEG